MQEYNDYRLVRSGGWFGLPASVVFVYVSLYEFRHSAIPQSYLDHLRRRLENARQGGVKLIIRHYYAFPGKAASRMPRWIGFCNTSNSSGPSGTTSRTSF